MSFGFILAILGIAIVGAIAFGTWYFSDEEKIRRALKNVPVSTIREAQSGQIARLVGQIKAKGPLLRSPVTDRDCAFYTCTVQEYRSSGKSGHWITVIRQTDAVDFLIDDGTGSALVRAKALKVAPDRDIEINAGTFRPATPELEAFLAKYGRESRGWLFNKRLRYREGAFEPGETVAVLGTVRWEQDPDSQDPGEGYRGAPRRAVVEPLPEGFVLASDQRDLR